MHTRADQLLSQLLIEHFDTLPTQFRHIELMHEGVWFPKNTIDKMAAMRTLSFFQAIPFVILNGFCICKDSSLMGRSTPTTAFDGAISHFVYTM